MEFSGEAWARLEADATCAICLDLFQDPVIFSCSHSFCLKCAKGLDGMDKPPPWYAAAAFALPCCGGWCSGPADDAAKGTVCPLCQAPVLFRMSNLALRNVIDSLRQQLFPAGPEAPSNVIE
ncbi:hypothetical protein DIPPA_30426, partial [Diplonema papillatum]|eukprot:gene20614-31754_t